MPQTIEEVWPWLVGWLPVGVRGPVIVTAAALAALTVFAASANSIFEFVRNLAPRTHANGRRTGSNSKPTRRSTSAPIAGKYGPLHNFLKRHSDATVSLTFVQIEEILGSKLPDSARTHRPWWANESRGSHVHARAWLGAAYRVASADLAAERIVFERVV